MPDSKFITVKLTNRKNDIKMEKGCSFENNCAIYHVDDKGALNIFDKNNKTWSVGKEINIHDYQLQTLMAVANNSDEIENGKFLKGVVLSKTDIDKAMRQHKEGGLSLDLARYLGGDYEIKSANRHTNYNGISTYVSNGNENTSSNLIFKFGTKENAVKLSEIVNKAKEVIKKVIPQAKNNSQPTTTPETKTKTNTTTEATSAKATKTTPQTTENKKTQNNVNTQAVTPKAKVTKSTSIENAQAIEKTTIAKASKKRTIDSMPEFYQVSLKTVANNLKISMYALKQEIKKVAQKTGYSEYFIAHLVSVEAYDKNPDKKGDGAITVGFGHTNLRDKNVTMKTKVTPQKAFAWLANDIKYFENYIKNLKINSKTGKTYGDYFDKLPSSLKEGLIDVAYNRNAATLQNPKIYESLQKNIENGDYHSAAVRIRQDFDYTVEEAKNHEHTTGLMKRNVYRFLLAVRDCDHDKIAAAKRRFENNGYYSTTKELLKFIKGGKSEIKLMDNAWNDIK